MWVFCPVRVFVRVFVKICSLAASKFWQQKSPGAIDTTSLELVELIARFELATSSLPTIFYPLLSYCNLLYLIGRTLYISTSSAFFRLYFIVSCFIVPCGFLTCPCGFCAGFYEWVSLLFPCLFPLLSAMRIERCW